MHVLMNTYAPQVRCPRSEPIPGSYRRFEIVRIPTRTPTLDEWRAKIVAQGVRITTSADVLMESSIKRGEQMASFAGTDLPLATATTQGLGFTHDTGDEIVLKRAKRHCLDKCPGWLVLCFCAGRQNWPKGELFFCMGDEIVSGGRTWIFSTSNGQEGPILSAFESKRDTSRPPSIQWVFLRKPINDLLAKVGW